MRFTDPGQVRRQELFDWSRELFEDALAPRSEDIALVHVPYDGTRLRAYLAKPQRSPPPHPVVVFLGEVLATTEMMLQCALGLTSRDIAVLALDGPGYGEALHRQDWPHATTMRRSAPPQPTSS